jgi:hypothetical protein
MSKYIPPSQRQPPTQQTISQSTEEKAPKKRHYEEQKEEEFPSLTIACNAFINPTMSFASIMKKVEEKLKPLENPYKPGWLYIKRVKQDYLQIDKDNHNILKPKSLIQFIEGPPVPIDEYYLSIDYDQQHSDYLFNKRIASMQEEQDRSIDTLGDLSPYWGQPDVLEVFYQNYGQEHQNNSDDEDNYSSSNESNGNYDALVYSD